MVTTTTASVSSMATKNNNNGNMLLYNNNVSPNVSLLSNSSAGGGNSCNSSSSLEQYRLQLYNYALNMERLRGPPYTAAAIAAAAACALTTSEPTASASGSVYDSNYTTSPGAPSPYICATASGLITAPSHIRHTSTLAAQCPSNRLALASMSLFPQRFFQPEEPKPQHSYIGLIAMAILSSAENKLVLSDIYQYILDNYPYFRSRGPGWRNSIRHNLSLNDCFIKSGRSANGKGHYWAIHPANMEDFRKGDFRRRKAQRKVRKHMGLAVDDNAIDSPSPPPAMDLTSPSPPSLPQYCSSIITPIATAAQQLAAHSFGWRFTHHPRTQQHHPQVATHTPAAAAAASYMGQIFTYRPQQHNSITTQYAATAASMCNNNATQKYHHHQQHLIATTTTTSHQSHQQIENYEQNQKSISFISSSSSYHDDKSEQRDTSSSATNVNAISELFSQKRKRQFDVASLLAPDNTHKRDHHNPYIRNDNDNPESSEVMPLRFDDDDADDDDENPKSNDLDIEDIDVVEASEEEYIEADDFDQDDEDDSNCNSHSQDEDEEAVYRRNFNKAHSRRLKNHCKITHLNITDDSRIKLQENDDNDDLEKNEKNDDDDFSSHQTQQHINNNNNISCNNIKNICILKQSPPVSAYEFFTHSQQYQRYNQTTSLCLLSPSAAIPANRPKNTTSPSPSHHPTVTQILELNEHKQNLQQLNPLNDAHQLIGRYYDTYIAAAAAARINSCVPANIVGKID